MIVVVPCSFLNVQICNCLLTNLSHRFESCYHASAHHSTWPHGSKKGEISSQLNLNLYCLWCHSFVPNTLRGDASCPFAVQRFLLKIKLKTYITPHMSPVAWPQFYENDQFPTARVILVSVLVISSALILGEDWDVRLNVNPLNSTPEIKGKT